MLLKVLFFLVIFDNSSSIKIRTFKAEYGDLSFYDPEAYTGSKITDSLSQCVWYCFSLDERCSLAYYTFSQKVCRLHVWKNIHSLKINKDPSVTMDTMLLVPRGHHAILLHTKYTGGKYNVLYSETGDVCRRVGGRLATEAELGESRTQIPNLCSCGWVHGGRSMYWLTTSQSGCCCLKSNCGYAPDSYFNVNCLVV